MRPAKNKSNSEANSNNIFITEKPGEADDQYEQEEEGKEEDMMPYPEQDAMEIIYSEEEILSFRNIFNMFDKDKTGYIDLNDFQSIMDSLNRNREEVQELQDEFGFGRDTGKLSFEEFIILMQALEKRIIVNEENEQDQPEFPEGEGEENRDGQLVQAEDHESPRSATDTERAQYGSLLPRTGVHFLPDTKVIDFLKLLDDYRKK